ncbi:hypothetical protein [Jeotgalibacillus aurantiacus]|nr:hypothetical protein [Jeotgalibacillus aurantiacus]
MKEKWHSLHLENLDVSLKMNFFDYGGGDHGGKDDDCEDDVSGASS